MTEPDIVTTSHAPWPWTAHVAGTEGPEMICGFGATRKAAVEDLRERLEDTD